MLFETAVKRVVDLIVELEKGSPTVPIEVWLRNPADPTKARRCVVLGVEQMTPARLRELDEHDDRTEPGPLPTVIYVEPKCDA